MGGRRISVIVLALLGALHLAWATPDIARAKVLDAYTVRMEAWAKPTVPEHPIDVAVMMLGDDVSDVLTIMVVRDVRGLTPTSADLADFCAAVAGHYFPAQRSVAENALTLPSDLEGSLGYWGEESWGSSSLICSLHDDAVELFALLSTDTDAVRTQGVVTRVASDAVTSGPLEDASAMESVADTFGGRRRTTELPGSDAIPAEFQRVDTDYQVGVQ